MQFSLLSSASLVIKIHLVFAVCALLLGLFQLLTKQGTPLHKALGKLWVLMILVICVTSFWIKEMMPNSIFLGYSPIHLLSIFVIIQMVRGIYYIKIGDIPKHKKTMASTYFGALIGAGAFTFFPGRLLYSVFFG
jgi:uncharacterized membrane protein